MKSVLTAGAAAIALALVSAPSVAVAQVTVVLAPEQQADYATWSAANRAAYDAWGSDLQTYFWTLTPEQRLGWWALNDEQRARVYGLDADARVQAWDSIAKQMANRSATAVAARTAAHMDNHAPGDVAAAVAEAKTYPVCGGAIQDSCINPREAGKKYGNRPLGHWPGAPASELKAKGKLSANQSGNR